MKKILLKIFFIASFIIQVPSLYAQSNQTYNNGDITAPINFTGGCIFSWTNSDPSIGLPASGTGNISAFTAINTGSTPIIATITATPARFTYVANQNSNTLAVINVSNGTIVKSINVGKNPEGVAVSPDGNYAYVSNTFSNSVFVISTATNTVIRMITVQTGPESLCLSPDGKTLYVANGNVNTISVINTTTYQIVKTLNTGSFPTALTISADGSKLYVVNFNSASISVFDTNSNLLITTFPVANGTEQIIVNPKNQYIYALALKATGVTVIDGNTNNVVFTIPVAPQIPLPGLGWFAISNDGATLYISDLYNNIIYVVSTITNKVIKQITLKDGTAPSSISLSADNSELYVADFASSSVSVISTLTDAVTKTINNVGLEPLSIANAKNAGITCPPITFTITVKPTPPPTIIPGAVTGTIYACKGTSSASPDIQQFNVSGNSLTGDITVTAPAGFEVSRNSDQGYSSSLILTQSLGVVTSSLIFVRSAATAPVGNNIMGNVTLSSPGATDQPVAVTATIYGIPIADVPTPQIKVNGAMTDPVFFKGSASSYTWVNNTTGIGLAAGGTGDIPSFTAINNTSSPIIALITVTPVNGADCDGSPDEFTITVEPTPTVLGVAGTLAPLTTVYGTASPAESFAVSCNTIDAKILITPPTGFEVSSDGTTFSPTITVTSTESNAPVTVYIRLESTDHVGAYGPGDVTISNPNAEKNASITMPEGSVTRAPLTITADNKTKAVGANNPALTASYSSFVNKDGPAQLTALPGLSTIATATSAVGQYAIDISGADSPDYNINYDMGVLTIVPSLNSSSIPNTFTPNGDGKNDTWVVTDLQYYPKATVNIFNRFGQKLYTSVGYPIPWDGKYKGKVLPSGTYYYIIDPKNGEPVLAGWVAIIR